MFLSLAGIIWGGLFLAVRMVAGVIEAVPLVWCRYILAFFALLVLGCSRHVDWHIDRRDWHLVALVGLIGQTLSIAAQESGTLLTSAQTGSVITAATPAFMVVFGCIILKERLSAGRLMSVALATIGVMLIVYDPDNFQVNLLGGIFLVVAALAWALMAVFLKLLDHYSPIVLTFYGLLVALVVLAPYSLWWLAARADFALLLTPAAILSILYMGVISTTLGFVFWNEGLLYMDASTAGLFMFWQPVVGTLLGWLLLGEPVTMWFFAGFVLIVSGVIMAIGRK